MGRKLRTIILEKKWQCNVDKFENTYNICCLYAQYVTSVQPEEQEKKKNSWRMRITQTHRQNVGVGTCVIICDKVSLVGDYCEVY